MADGTVAPLFSVIIPAYNYGEFLPEAVESVLRQPGDDYEIIIVDDGSTDQTPLVAQEFANGSARVRNLHQENAGPGAARNHGVRAAHGTFCLFLDADDRLVDGALSTFRQVVARHPEVGMVLAGHVSLHADGRRRVHLPPPLSADCRANFVAYLRKRVSVSNGASVVARRVFERYNFPEDIRNGEDVVVFAKTIALYPCHAVAVPVLEIRKHAASLRNRIDSVLQAGDRVVAHLFDPQVLPPWAMTHRNEFHARQLLSLFRSCYLARCYPQARNYYREAIRLDIRLLFNLSALRKFLRILVR